MKRTYATEFVKKNKLTLHHCIDCGTDFGFFSEKCPKCGKSYLQDIDKAYEDYCKSKDVYTAYNSYKETEALKKKLYGCFKAEDYDEATEIIVKFIKKNEHIYTIRKDEKSEIWIYVYEGINKGIYVPDGKTYIKEHTRILAEKSYTKTLVSQVIAKIEADTYINQDVFFRIDNVYELPVENGILDINTRELSNFTPKKKFFNKLPVYYDPKQTCPSIMKHFRAVLKGEKDVKVMQEAFGFVLLKDYKPEKAIMMLGTGRNGKGKTIELMKRFLGPDNCVNIPLKALEGDNSFNICELHNKMVNLGSDISNTTLKETNTFKELTGHDMVSASRKFKTKVHFQNFAKMIFSANELPKTYDKTPAFFNRWLFFDFPYTFVTQKDYDAAEDKSILKLRDPDIIEKLSCPLELSGLLNWALEGYKRLKEHGDFSKGDTEDDIKSLWIRRSDSFASFFEDCMIVEYDSAVTKKDLRKLYTQYLKLHKLTSSVSDKYIRHILTTDYGASENRHNIGDERTYCWDGIKFNKKHEKEFIGQGGYGGQGISVCVSSIPPTKESNRNTLANLTTLTIIEVYDILVSEKHTKEIQIQDIQSKFDFDIDDEIEEMKKSGDFFDSKPGYIMRCE